MLGQLQICLGESHVPRRQYYGAPQLFLFFFVIFRVKFSGKERMFGVSSSGFGTAANTAGGFGTAANPTGGFGTAANPTGGFGTAANTAGGFGTAANTAGGFGTAANTAGGFGTAANTAGGFGTAANTAGGFGTAANTAGGFGTAANTAGGFGTAANPTGGFGTAANTAGGFGTAANLTGGFGTAANPTGGFGTAANPTGGFGTAANTAGGFGTAANIAGGFGVTGGLGFTAAGGFGAYAGAKNNNMVGMEQNIQEFGSQSTAGRYLLELDNAYNALHPNCRFRAFLYNMCAPGQSTMAVERERFIAAQAGGGCKEEELLRAQERNPDPLRMYPSPIHFMQELKARAEKQQEVITAMTKHVDVLISKSERFREMDEANVAQYRELMLEQVMLQRRWYSLLKKVETLRQLGLPLGEESRIARIVKTLNLQLSAPGVYRTALSELQPFLDAESATVASLLRSRPGDEAREPVVAKEDGMLQRRTDPQLLKNWTRFAERIQEGVEALIELLEKDSADMRAIRHRVGLT
ncbi:nucleoporin (NUP54/57), putative [Trypanosoma cruzi]|uniref:Nucleoporin (NUP54/57), putative n=2 Tax=Trypanosoma cruzi TaxID=5693 RepID=Q4CWI5_TRYCC|nr:nucleoporin (NUP54/57), putative [Trypanosoma cruzi]EAN84640.1 nucleoporin (NUP54/57), putative [Trypanosoma cruzi]|eukprot:XP_806491.1 nucleoporin (NUP54/57) [Trypanosoma cruzi strain CL Brener]